MRSRMILLLALAMGIITTVLFFNYTNQGQTAEVAVQQETVQVVRAKEEIAENQLINRDVLEVVNVPKENISPQAATEMAEVEGKYSTAIIAQGEILVTHRVKDQQAENVMVSRKIKAGYRAVSVGTPRVQSVESVTNLIEPEDHVDVVLTETVVSDGEEALVSERIFSNIRVLAVGRKMNPPANGESNYVEYSAVTLELEPEDATELINASNRGIIHFTLQPSIIPPDEEE